mmetsp:Transcript_1802/g.5420  ORF Transcript_1802/g.5420 Transcript_1802/m.5420 type:complete len:220 (-) Transcript_1802:20-679(-)
MTEESKQSDWDSLRASARGLESTIDNALPQLAALVAGGGGGADERRLAKDLERRLDELDGVRAALADAAKEAPSAARMAVVARYGDALAEYRADLKRSARDLRRNTERARLFEGAGEGDPEDGSVPDHMRAVLAERRSTVKSMRGVGETLDAAHEARADLAAQRQTLEGSTATIAGMVGRLPTVDGVIAAMRQKKTRHNAVIGVTIGCCASFLLWAVFT